MVDGGRRRRRRRGVELGSRLGRAAGEGQLRRPTPPSAPLVSSSCSCFCRQTHLSYRLRRCPFYCPKRWIRATTSTHSFRLERRTHYCGSVLTWGRGTCGQLGHGDVENCLKPKPVGFFEQIVISYISAGWNHSGFVSDSGSLFTCGDGSFGQLGHGDYQSRSSPTKVLFFASKHVKKIACGMRHSLVLSKGPSGLGDLLYAFGSGRRGQLGTSLDSSRKSIAVPQAIHGFKDDEMVAVSANGDHSAILSANGHLYFWGRGFSGTSDSHLPHLLPSPLKFSQVALGWNHALLLTDCGEVFMLGRMLGGQQESLELQVPLCSTPSITPDEVCRAMIPTRVPGFDGVKVVDIGAGAEHSALVTENGTVMTWGWGEHGQLGLGDTCDHMIPQTVTMENGQLDASAWFRVYCGSGFTIAVGSTSLHSQS